MKHHMLTRALLFLGAAALLPALPLLLEPAEIPNTGASLPEIESSVSAEPADESSFQTESIPEQSAEVHQSEMKLPASYSIYNAETGEVMELSPFDYICGVTAAEIPITYPEDAIRAQAVAAHSYALYQIGRSLDNPDPALKGASLSTDPAHYQAYYSKEEREELWGSTFAENEEKLTQAVGDIIGIILTSEGKPVAAAFHAISAGRTESAADIWGTALPCLVPADSPEDAENPDAYSEVSLTLEEAAAILSANFYGISLPENPSDWFRIRSRTESGTVTELETGGEICSGDTIRNLFGLASANFTVSYKDEIFTFSVKGRGHGVGMSQEGASAMAEAGSSWEEILLHYYPGAELTALLS